MKILLRFVQVMLFILSSASVLFAQWQGLDGSLHQLGWPEAMVNVPNGQGSNTLLASGRNGVFLSTDNGASWAPSNTYPAGLDFYNFAVIGGDIFAEAVNSGTGTATVYLSTDAGKSWTWSGNGLPDGTTITAFTSSQGNLIASTVGNGRASMYLSTDNGASWTLTGLNLPSDAEFYCFGASGSNVFAGGEGLNSYVFRSTNSGVTWTTAGSGSILAEPYCIAISGTNLFLGNQNGVLRSTDNGATWGQTNSGLPSNSAITGFALVGNNILAGRSSPTGAIYRSTDNGNSWTQDNPVSESFNFNCFYVQGTEVFASITSGIFLSTDSGVSWKRINNSDMTAFTFAVKNGGFYAGSYHSLAEVYPNSLLQSWDYLTLLWITSYLNISAGSTDINVMAGNNNILAFGTPVGAFFINDTMNVINNSGVTNTNFTALAFLGNTLYGGTSGGGVYEAINNDTLWISVNSGLTNQFVNVLISNGANLYAGTQGGVFLTTDNGGSWTGISSGLTDLNITSLTFSGANFFAGTDSEGVFMSTDNGTNWTQVSSGLTNKHILCLDATATDVFAGTRGGGVFHSPNTSISWSSVNTGLGFSNNLNVNSLALYPSSNGGTNLVAGILAGGVWVRPVSQMLTGIANNKSNVALSFTLNQNYPNPFNPSTIIKYEIPKESFVTLKVYDILGREVKTLVNENRPAGSYEVTFNAGNLSSGIYFYTIKAGNFLQTKKLVLLK